MTYPLATYLHDHLGGAKAAIDLLAGNARPPRTTAKETSLLIF